MFQEIEQCGTRRPIARCGLSLFASLLLLSSLLTTAGAGQVTFPDKQSTLQRPGSHNRRQDEKEVRTLKPDEPIKRELAGGEVHSYRIMLTSGEYLRIAVDQQGINLAVSLRGPDGVQLMEMDGLSGMAGVEELSWEAASSGWYMLEVGARAQDADKGRYEVRLQQSSEATGRERARIAAERLYMEGRRGHEEGRRAERQRAIKRYKEAAKNYEEAVAKWREAGERKWEALTLNHLGSVYVMLSQPEKALASYRKVLVIRRELKDRRGAGATLNHIGNVYLNLKQYEKARRYLEPALKIRRKIKDTRDEGETLNNLGVVYSSLGEKQKALDFYNQALSFRRAVGDRSGEAQTLSNIASLERKVGNYIEARSRIEAALNLVESVRVKFTSQEQRAIYFASIRKYYGLYIDVLMLLHKERPSEGFNVAALQASERARARSLLELLTEAGANIRQGVDAQLLERERTLQQQLNAAAERQMRLLSDKHTEEQAAALGKEVKALVTEYQRVEAQIRRSSPRYAALTQPRPLSLKEIQTDILDRDTLLLEYALGTDRSYLWAVTPTSLHSFELPSRSEIEVAARHVYQLLTARNRREGRDTAGEKRERVAQADAEYPAAAAALSKMLLGPVAAQLGNKRLLIVSDGALQYVPFAALPTPATTHNAPMEAKPPLIVEHEVVNLPSASTLAVMRRELRGRRPAAKAVAVLADPVFTKDDERVKPANPVKRTGEPSRRSAERAFPPDLERNMEDLGETGFSQELPRLYHTRREAKVINSLVPAQESMQGLDFAANRTIATSTELSQYRIVHFATHAFINNTHPQLSGIVLSLVDERGQPQDGFLRAHEIFNLKLSSELVVLSACRTGLGKEVKGEGLIGLTRAFMYAGTPRVVVSLWSLNDKPTAELMARFYQKMLGTKRLSPAAALRAAQIEMWKDSRWQSAYFWAPFVLQGEWR